MPLKPRYAVRADHLARVYEVYEIATGEAIRSFIYGRKESKRGVAHGLANIERDILNREAKKQQPKFSRIGTNIGKF